MKKRQLIAFCGAMGSGKTYAADYLIQNFGYTRVKFAKPLKDMLRAIGLTDEHIEGELKDLPCDLLDGRTPRWAMQSLGTEWGRTLISENLWGNLWEKQVESLLQQNKPVVVDDCRFNNEAERVKRLKGSLFLIMTPRSETAEARHPSEVLPTYEYWDGRLENSKDEEFDKYLDVLVRQPKRFEVLGWKTGLPAVNQNGWAR